MSEVKDKKDKAVTTEAVQAAQADYKGNSHFDLEDITIIKDGDFYKKGDTDKVHPTVAAILRLKGLVASNGNDL